MNAKKSSKMVNNGSYPNTGEVRIVDQVIKNAQSLSRLDFFIGCALMGNSKYGSVESNVANCIRIGERIIEILDSKKL